MLYCTLPFSLSQYKRTFFCSLTFLTSVRVRRDKSTPYFSGLFLFLSRYTSNWFYAKIRQRNSMLPYNLIMYCICTLLLQLSSRKKKHRQFLIWFSLLFCWNGTKIRSLARSTWACASHPISFGLGFSEVREMSKEKARESASLTDDESEFSCSALLTSCRRRAEFSAFPRRLSFRTYSFSFFFLYQQHVLVCLFLLFAFLLVTIVNELELFLVRNLYLLFPPHTRVLPARAWERVCVCLWLCFN